MTLTTMSTDPHSTSSIDQCLVIELPRHRHTNGSLSVVDNTDAPFAVRRVFYLYDVPAGSERGGHSHYNAQELIVAVGGCFDVVLSDGKCSRTYRLDRPYKALYVARGIWRELNNFSGGSVCMVLTSEEYSEADYVRSPEEFKRLTCSK